MTKYEVPIIVATGRERPTHGYEVGQLLLDTLDFSFYQLVSKNPHIWLQTGHKSPLTRKSGRYEANGMNLYGTGMMADLVALGNTFTPNGMDASGTSQNFSTGSTVQNAGIAILRPVGSFNGLTRPNFLPIYATRQVLPSRATNEQRFYSGWITTTTPPVVGEAPILQADGGLIVGYNAADTNWAVWHGDGTAAISKVPLVPDIPAPSASISYKVEVQFTTASNVVVTVSDGSTNALLGTATITSNLPASAKTMNWANVTQNINANGKSITIYGAYMEATK